jgi:hypothetical protein
MFQRLTAFSSSNPGLSPPTPATASKASQAACATYSTALIILRSLCSRSCLSTSFARYFRSSISIPKEEALSSKTLYAYHEDHFRFAFFFHTGPSCCYHDDGRRNAGACSCALYPTVYQLPLSSNNQLQVQVPTQSASSSLARSCPPSRVLKHLRRSWCKPRHLQNSCATSPKIPIFSSMALKR